MTNSRPVKLIRLLANLGYGSRKEVEKMLRNGAVTNREGVTYGHKASACSEDVLLNGEELDPLGPLVLVMNKPIDYTCSTTDPEATIYDLLPPRFSLRNPGLNPIGRLDKDTSGLLLLTDDGKFLHRVIHPKSGCEKCYHVQLDRPLEGNEAEIFAAGDMMLESEKTPLLPAKFTATGDKEGFITLSEGRYHQIRRMFAAIGNHVVELKRLSIGGFSLPEDIAEGDWRLLSEEEISSIFQ